MTVINFYKNGLVQATNLSDVVITKDSFKYFKEGGQCRGELPLDYLKKIVIDGVTIWEAD